MSEEKLIIEVSFQFYGENEQERKDVIEQLAKTLVAVAYLPDIAIGTFVSSHTIGVGK